MSGKILKQGALALAFALPGIVTATPVYDYFGAFDPANFGGTGIPNDPVAVSTQIVDGSVTITLAMSATQRYSNPAVTDDGNGTYLAQAGSNFGGAGESTTEGALWNWNFFISVQGDGATLGDYDFDIFYDFDPVEDNALPTLGKLTVGPILGSDTVFQGSQNLMFNYLAGIPPLPGVTPPGSPSSFDPNATGEYNFAIQASKNGFNLESVAMDVKVVPIPAAAWLFGSALLGLGVIARRKTA